MFPPEFDSIAKTLLMRFRSWVSEDGDASELPNLEAVERQVTTFVRETGRAMLQAFVDVRRDQAKAARAACDCGMPREVHRSPQWPRKTLLGPIVVTDVYAYCRVCGSSDRPLHEWLGTDREVWSLAVQEAAVDLAADESCEKAVGKLARHHPGVEMGRTTALRQLHEHGERARVFIDQKLASAVESIASAGKARSGAPELEVEFDGGMIPVATLAPIEPAEGKEVERTPVRNLPKRKKTCRWEEVKAGLVQAPGETTRLYTLRPTGGLDEAFDDLLALACLKNWTEKTQVRGISDGARHIRPRMEETFHASPFQFILDRPHCKEHLTDAGEALQPLTGTPAQEWASRALDAMETGGAAAVVAELRAAHQKTENDTLRLEANYFEHNADAVLYAEYRERGWSTASSEIESAHGNIVQARMKISGAWWHPDGVDDILALRILKANGWWDEYWASQREEWSRRAAEFAKPRLARAA